MKIDCDFPGGNIIVEQIDGDTIDIRQDIRDTSEWWFWWAFRVKGAASRRLTFHFTNGDVFTAMGPCVSFDGVDWRWLGRISTPQTSFRIDMPADVGEAYFALAPFYTQRNIESFIANLAQIAPSHQLQRNSLCVSERGRTVEFFTVAAEAQSLARTAVFTARTHACECSANFVLEGLITQWLSGKSDAARWLRRSCNLVVVPFIDKDGVESGDQGKSRAPHDHNRDFADSPLYASVRALQNLLLDTQETVAIFLDIHSPWIRHGLNETLFFIGVPEPWQAEQNRLTAILERVHKGSVPFHACDTIAHGMDWNKGEPTKSDSWVRTKINPRISGCIEVAYALANGVAVTPNGLRDIGASLAESIGLYLQNVR